MGRSKKTTRTLVRPIAILGDPVIHSLRLGKTLSDKPTRAAGVFHTSGHLIDLGLLSSYEMNKKQLDFRHLLKILPAKASELDLGIRLTAAEDALKITLEQLLFKYKSKNGLGNFQSSQADLMGKTYDAPRLLISFQELARQHTGKKKPSGGELEDVRKTLESLRKKEHLIRLVRTDKDGKRTVIVDYTRLIVNYVEGYDSLSESENTILEQRLEKAEPLEGEILKKGKLLLTFNPIFALDLDTKYIKRPNDLNERTLLACGKNNKPAEAIRRLRDYLLRQLTDPRTKNTRRHEIGKEKLIYTLGLDKFQREGRRKLVEKRLKEAFEACMHEALPLIEKIEESSDIAGNPKYIFTLNTDFPTPLDLEPADSIETLSDAAN